MLSLGPCCCDPPCDQTFHIKGCNGFDLTGATVTAVQGSKTVTTILHGTNIVLSLSSGSWAVTVTRIRFETYTDTITVPNPCAPATWEVQMTVLAAAYGGTYVCTPLCALPLATTLNVFTLAGSHIVTLNYFPASGDWRGSVWTLTADLSTLSFPHSGASPGDTYTLVAHDCTTLVFTYQDPFPQQLLLTE